MDGRTPRRAWQEPSGRNRADIRVHAKSAGAEYSAWVTASVWTIAAMAAFAVAGAASFLRLANVLFGLLIVSPALAEEVADGERPAAPIEERLSGSGVESEQISDADNLATFTIMPDVWLHPSIVFAADDGANAGPAAAPAMQLAFAAIGSVATSMTVSYPFGFWCADSWRVLAGSDASHLNRICGSVISGGGFGLDLKREGNSTGGSTPGTLLSCEDGRAVVASELNSRVSIKNNNEYFSGGAADNTLGGTGLGTPGNSVSVQQNGGLNSIAQSSVRVFVIGSF